MISGERIDQIKCYLTGARLDTGEFTVRRIQINDKHGKTRSVFNSKANIYRGNTDPILLGIPDRDLSQERRHKEHSEHVLRAVPDSV